MENDDWESKLDEDEYKILRQCGTEPRYSSELLDIEEDGVFRCAGCGNSLFRTSEKFDSGTGWPSFYDVLDSDNIETQPDEGLIGTRTEVLCADCGGHLGHVFEDGPKPTGLRYCINGVALEFESDS